MEVTILASFIMNGDWKYNNSRILMAAITSTNTINSNKKPGMMPRDDANCSKALLALQRSAPVLSVLQTTL
jgi:hypothetical protein